MAVRLLPVQPRSIGGGSQARCTDFRAWGSYEIMDKTLLGACVTGLLMASTGCGYYDPLQGEAADDEAVASYQEGVEEELGEEPALPPACRTPAICGDSVYYARCRQPRLPRGLRSYREK